MRGAGRHGLPHPAADVSPWGDVAAAVSTVRQRIADKGEQMVLVSASGRVYLLQPRDGTTTHATRRHPSWVAGVFDANAGESDLREALVHSYNKSLRVLQAPPGEMRSE